MKNLFWSWFAGVVFGIILSGTLMKYNQNENDVNYRQCVTTYENCNVSDVLAKLAQNGEVLMSNHDDDTWYIRYELEVDENVEYNFQSEYRSTPEYALYNLIFKINNSGVKL